MTQIYFAPSCPVPTSHCETPVMKIQQLALSFWPLDEAEPLSPSTSSSSIMLSINLIGPLAPCKLAPPPPAMTSPCTKIMPALDMKSLNSPRPSSKCALQKPDTKCLMQRVPSGTTRWNPMPEQIKALEALYQSGVRTPNAKQIEDITAELSKYGRIEGKNVFYWFQNHKSRERQKLKRSALSHAVTMSNSATRANSSLLDVKLLQQEEKEEEAEGEHEMKERKRTCRGRWCGLQLHCGRSGSGGHDQTLELFPLHPERKQM